MIADGAAIASAERDGLFACLAGFDAVVLAVSGGADSIAMLHLAASWAHDQGRSAPRLSVATVDHGLRPGSAAEARAVATIAAQLGLAHSTLTWTGAKPARGIQAAARTARYRLLAGHERAHRIDAVAVAHTLDDQAETLLMRLARGSGVDGLAAMQLQASIEGVAVLRPLLGIARARLRATLRQQGATWIDDPTNARPEFER